jgi:hypothetical protein
VSIQFNSGHSDASEVSPPDTAGKLGGASFFLSGAAAFSFIAKPADGLPFGARRRRISERLPAVSAGLECASHPSKAIICRTISETSMASEPPPSGSQAPVSASSPVLIGANSISSVHRLNGVRVHLPVSHFARDRDCSECHGAERQHCNCNDLRTKHDCISVIRWNVETTE